MVGQVPGFQGFSWDLCEVLLNGCRRHTSASEVDQQVEPKHMAVGEPIRGESVKDSASAASISGYTDLGAKAFALTGQGLHDLDSISLLSTPGRLVIGMDYCAIKQNHAQCVILTADQFAIHKASPIEQIMRNFILLIKNRA